MNKPIEISKKHYTSLVWHILEKYFLLNPEHRGRFSRDQGTVGIFSKTIALDAYFYLLDVYLSNEHDNFNSDKFKNIRSSILRWPEEIENSSFEDIRIKLAEKELPSLKLDRYTQILSKLTDLKKRVEEKGNELSEKLKIAELERTKFIGKIITDDLAKKKKELEGNIESFKETIKNLKIYKKKDKSLLVSQLYKNLLENALIPSNFDGNSKSTKLSKLDLDVMCIYAFDLTFDNFISQESSILISEGKINLIHTDISENFFDVVSNIIKTFELATKNGGSKSLIETHLKIFNEKTKEILSEISSGTIKKERDDYLKDLLDFITKCSYGLGVNIPDFDENFQSAVGKKILAVNKKQSEGKYLHFKAAQYARILFLKSNNPKKISVLDQKFLLSQSKHGVDIYIILTRDVNDYISKNEAVIDIADLDFALLRVNDAPIVADSFINHSTENPIGTFYHTKNKARQYYDMYLKNLLDSPSIKKYTIEEGCDCKKLRELSRRDLFVLNGIIENIIKE